MELETYAPLAIAGLQFLGMTGAAVYRAFVQDARARENRHVVPVALGCLVAASGLLAAPFLSLPTVFWLLAGGMSCVTLPTLFDIRHIAQTAEPEDTMEVSGSVHTQREQKPIVFVDRTPAILSLQLRANMGRAPTPGASNVRDVTGTERDQLPA